MTTNVTHDQAMDALQHEYHTEIRAIAESCVKECYEPETQQPREGVDVHDWLHSTIDDHQWVIYTHRARLVLVLTEHPDAYEDEMGERPGSVEQAAYWAMLADVQALLGNEYFVRDMFPASATEGSDQ